MLSCKEVSRLVSESLDQRLSLWQRMQVWLHLRMCKLCSRFRQQTLFLGRAARHYLSIAGESAPEAQLTATAKDRMKQALRSGAQ